MKHPVSFTELDGIPPDRTKLLVVAGWSLSFVAAVAAPLILPITLFVSVAVWFTACIITATYLAETGRI